MISLHSILSNWQLTLDFPCFFLMHIHCTKTCATFAGKQDMLCHNDPGKAVSPMLNTTSICSWQTTDGVGEMLHDWNRLISYQIVHDTSTSSCCSRPSFPCQASTDLGTTVERMKSCTPSSYVIVEFTEPAKCNDQFCCCIGKYSQHLQQRSLPTLDIACIWVGGKYSSFL